VKTVFELLNSALARDTAPEARSLMLLADQYINSQEMMAWLHWVLAKDTVPVDRFLMLQADQFTKRRELKD